MRNTHLVMRVFVNPKRRLKKGFSLIEVLFAVFITSLCAAMLAATMPVATASREKADTNNKATSLIQKQLEAVRGIGYGNLTPAQMFTYKVIDSANAVSADTYSWTNVDSVNKDNPAQILKNGTGTIKVESIDTDLRRVTVTVTWTDRGTTRTLSAATLVANL